MKPPEPGPVQDVTLPTCRHTAKKMFCSKPYLQGQGAAYSYTVGGCIVALVQDLLDGYITEAIEVYLAENFMITE